MGTYQNTYKITSADKVDKGVVGLPDTPGLSTGDMQARFDSLANLSIDKFNAVVDSVGDVISNDPNKLPTMKAIVDYVISMGGGDMAKSVYDTDDNGIVDNAEALGGHGATYFKNQYALSLPTTGYTDETVTIWGESKNVKAIEITTDKDGNTLDNFAADMSADYLINLNGDLSDFIKVYAHEIGANKVTFYLTDVPTNAFNVLVREA